MSYQEADWPTWVESSSGSGAVDPWDAAQATSINSESYMGSYQDQDSEFDLEDQFGDEALVTGHTFGMGEFLRPGEQMTSQIPPAYNGSDSWFTFEELVNDWEDSCVLDEKKRGPALKNRLTGQAAIFRRTLDREKLKQENGVEYFLNTLRPQFLKGVQNVFLFRLFQFMRLRRGRRDIHQWLARYALMRKRLGDSWNDLYTPPAVGHVFTTEQTDELVDWCSKQGVNVRDLNPAEKQAKYDNMLRIKHEQNFPFGENLYTLIFMIQSELSESQRTLLTTQLTLRNVRLPDYNFELMRTLFLECLAGPKSTLDDPNVRPRSQGGNGNRSFFIEEEGQMDGQEGYWAEDVETGLEGFLPENDNVFWVLEDQPAGEAWVARRFKSRKIVRNRKGKGKGKGRKGRKRFSRRGSSRMTEDDEKVAEAWAVIEEALKGKGKRKGKGKFKGKGKGKFSHPDSGKSDGKSKGKGKGDKNKGKAHEASTQSP